MPRFPLPTNQPCFEDWLLFNQKQREAPWHRQRATLYYSVSLWCTMLASLTCCPDTWHGSLPERLLWTDLQGLTDYTDFWLAASTGLVQPSLLIIHPSRTQFSLFVLLTPGSLPNTPDSTFLASIHCSQRPSVSMYLPSGYLLCPLDVCPLSLVAQFTHILWHTHVQSVPALCQVCSCQGVNLSEIQPKLTHASSLRFPGAKWKTWNGLWNLTHQMR